MPDSNAPNRLTSRDRLLLASFCLLLFGFSMVSGRPLSLHEAVLPQSAREMLADGDWIVPKKGDTPWLESPPLPQWVTVSLATVIGRCDAEWIVRLGPTLVGAGTTLLVAWMAALWFGRHLGLISGFVFATTCQFTRYTWLAEDEIYLCGVITLAVAAFVKLEFDATDGTSTTGLRALFANRHRGYWVFFIALGMTNLVKGLMFGTVMAMVPISLFLLANHDLRRIRQYVWLGGAVVFLAVSLAWPLAAWLRYPDVVDVWRYDLGGRLDGSYITMAEPWWYYPVNLLWMLAPWTLVIPFGLKATWFRAVRERFTPERFLWCWALGVPLVFSLPHGKHHHYLLHALAPWSIIGAIGLVRVREALVAWPQRWKNPWNSLVTTALPIVVCLVVFHRKIPVPDAVLWGVIGVIPFLTVFLSWALLHRNRQFAATTLFCTLGIVYCGGHWIAGKYVDRHRQDVAFLKQVNERFGHDHSLLVDMNIDPLVGFLHLFYLSDQAVPMHNITFVAAEEIKGSQVLVLTRESLRDELERLGEVETELRGWKTDRNNEPLPDQLALFRLTYRPDAERIPAEGIRVSPMQAMLRESGPFLRRL